MKSKSLLTPQHKAYSGQMTESKDFTSYPNPLSVYFTTHSFFLNLQFMIPSYLDNYQDRWQLNLKISNLKFSKSLIP